MNTLLRTRNSLLTIVVAAMLATVAMLLLLSLPAQKASAAACTAPATDYGTVSNLTVNITNTETYRVWTRMAAADTTNDTYLLEIDGTTCYTVGGNNIPTYTAGATTHFVGGSSNWTSKTSTNANIDVSLTAGSHTLKLIGNAPGVVVDSLIFTQDTACVPTDGGSNCASSPDVTAPIVSITSPANAATISGTTTVTANATDNVAVSKVEFYVDGTLAGTDTTADASDNFTYSLNPAGLAVGSHNLTAKAYDAANNNTTSSVRTFNIADTTAPTVTLTAPTNGSTVSGTIVATATAADNIGVAKVEFYVDGVLKATDTSTPYSASIDTTALTNGTRSFTARAYDAANLSTNSAAASVTVNNQVTPPADTTPPTVSISAPAAGATISGTVTVTASASDASGISQVQFYVDNVLKSTDTTAPYSFSLDTTTLSNASHAFKAVATDNSTNANVATSATINATVSNVVLKPADINADGSINVLDLSILASKYGQTGSSLGRADINGDGIVNVLDLSILASNYGK